MTYQRELFCLLLLLLPPMVSTSPPLFITSISNWSSVRLAYFLAATETIVWAGFVIIVAGFAADRVAGGSRAFLVWLVLLSFKWLSTSHLSRVWCGPVEEIWFGSSLYWFSRFLTLGPIACDFLNDLARWFEAILAALNGILCSPTDICIKQMWLDLRMVIHWITKQTACGPCCLSYFGRLAPTSISLEEHTFVSTTRRRREIGSHDFALRPMLERPHCELVQLCAAQLARMHFVRLLPPASKATTDSHFFSLLKVNPIVGTPNATSCGGHTIVEWIMSTII